MAYIVMQSPIGRLIIQDKDEKIVHLYFACDNPDLSSDKQENTPVLLSAKNQTEEYFLGKRKQFCLNLQLEGTLFMQNVWQKMLLIPYGQTSTYGQLAVQVNSSKGARAVGLACNRNPVPIFVPCHRVVGAKGALTGFAGGLDVKEILLDLEKRNSR